MGFGNIKMLLPTIVNGEALMTLVLGSCALCLPVLLASKTGYSFIYFLFYPLVIHRAFSEKLWRIIDLHNIIQDKYNKANGKPFAIRTADARVTFISNRKMIAEVDRASDDVLSLQAASKILLQAHRTMHQFDLPAQRGSDGTPHIETLRYSLKRNLPFVLARSYPTNATILEDIFSNCRNRAPLNGFVRKAVARTNALAMFGDELGNDEQFIDTAVCFYKQVLLIGEIVRLLPAWISRYLAPFLESRCNAQRIIFARIKSAVQARMHEQEQGNLGYRVTEHKDCIQWMLEHSSNMQPGTAPKTVPWTSERITHELMALWFGALHAVTVTAILAAEDLCLHPEYLEPLRKELEGHAYKRFEEHGYGLPLLDSFIKESARMTPVDSVSTRRRALQPFEFSNGLRIERDEWVCTPVRAMHQDPQKWTQPHEFNGFRHVDPAILASTGLSGSFSCPQPHKARPFTDVRWADSWQTWGTGHVVCPGRFYSSAAIKQILGLMLSHCDFAVEKRSASRFIGYRGAAVPGLCTSITLSRRQYPDNK